jgi:hypothetical protein
VCGLTLLVKELKFGVILFPLLMVVYPSGFNLD